jgi:hypothetical protein
LNIKKKTYSDGSVYEGEWILGQRHGKGKIIYSDGTVHKGEWSEGERGAKKKGGDAMSRRLPGGGRF